MSLWKDMTLNERVFHQNINSGPLIVTYHLSISLYINLYLWICGLISEITGPFQVNWEYPTMDVTYKKCNRWYGHGW